MITIFINFYLVFCYALSILLSMKLTGEDCSFFTALIIAAVTGLIEYLFHLGWIPGSLVMGFMIYKMTRTKFYPDAILVVIISHFFVFLTSAAIASWIFR